MSRSTYVFPTEEDYNDAKEHIYQKMYSDYCDSNKIWFRDWWGACSLQNSEHHHPVSRPKIQCFF